MLSLLLLEMNCKRSHTSCQSPGPLWILSLYTHFVHLQLFLLFPVSSNFPLFGHQESKSLASKSYSICHSLSLLPFLAKIYLMRFIYTHCVLKLFSFPHELTQSCFFPTTVSSALIKPLMTLTLPYSVVSFHPHFM